MLELRNVHVRYGKVNAVQGVDLSVTPGRVTLVLGPNGAGKSSTLKAVAGLERLHIGQVSVDGYDISNAPAHRVVKRGISLVPEGRRVFAPLTVRENLRMGAYLTGSKRAAAALEQVLEMFPILGERSAMPAGLLSGGEQQMLAFGRALMAEPRFVLLDEPSMGLAPSVVDSVLATVRDMADSGIGVLMVEQNAEAGLELADDVVALARGQVVYRGDVAEARDNAAVLRAFLGESALAQGANIPESTS